MSMQQITAAAAAMLATADAYAGKIGQIDARLGAKEALVDGFIDLARFSLTSPERITYNATTILSKNALNLAVDPLINSRTVWSKINSPISSVLYSNPNDFAILELERSFSYAPGFYEVPVAYAADKSSSHAQFVVAGEVVSSAAISAYIEANNIIPFDESIWALIGRAAPIPILEIPNSGQEKALWIRFVNKAFTEAPEVLTNTAPQEITQFGGNCTVVINSLNKYSF
jgi:hypothetical protein